MSFKMNNTALKIGLAAGLLYYYVLRGASALFVGIRSYGVQSINTAAGTMTLQVNFVINNPLWVGLRLRSIDGEVYIQGVKCGTIDMFYDYYLSGRHAHVIPVQVVVDVKSIGQAALLNINSGDVRTLTVDFNGGVTVGKSDLMRIPIQKTLDWEDIRG